MKRALKFIVFLSVISILFYVLFPYVELYQLSKKDILKFENDKSSFRITEKVPLTKVDSVLLSNGYIDSSVSLKKLILFKNYEDDTLMPGKYSLKKKWNASTLLNQLYLMRKQLIVDLYIPSCRNLASLAGRLANQIDIDSTELIEVFNDNNTHEKFGFTSKSFPTFFIPTTLEVYRNISTENLMELLANHYKEFWTVTRKNKASSLNLKPSEVTTLASIVQMEQQANYNEHKTIAGLYVNRLKIDMKLQADPTVKFALNKPQLKRVLRKHLSYDSPYNTYLYEGLPPGPIYIPEPSVIDAVLNYEKHNYIYMCAEPSYKANHSFAVTYNEHLKNYNKYKNWLNSQGIN